MKAIRLYAFADPSQLKEETLDEPQPKAGEIRVRVAASGVNPIDWKTCSGGGASAFIGDLPWIPGWETAGVVDAVGEGVTGWQRGDRAMGLLNFPQPGNCYAEQVCAAAEQWAPVPAPVSLVDAGGLPLAGLTAWQALYEQANLQPGQQVLILAAAGGVGHLAVQIAHAEGASVIGTASSANHDWLTELGCERCIDYRQQCVGELLKDIDVIIDCVGGDSAIAALDCLKTDGVMVTLPSVTAEQVTRAGAARSKTVKGIRVRPDAEQLARLGELAEQNKLTLKIDSRLRLGQVMEAHERSAKGHAQGKILLTP